MNNIPVEIDLQSLRAAPKGQLKRILVELQKNAVVNFSVLGKFFNLSMAKEADRKVFLLFKNCLEKKTVSAIIDGEFFFSPTDRLMPSTHKASRLIILDRIPIFEAVCLRIFLKLENWGWFPQRETESSPQPQPAD